MTAHTVTGSRSTEGVDQDRGAMIMTVASKVGAMTTLTVLCAGGGRSAALQDAGRRVMTGEAV